MRKTVVSEIDRFARRNRTYEVRPRIIVTTRPSTNELPEPSADQFDVLVLSPLITRQCEEYLRKWSGIRGITGAAGRALRTTYRAKIAGPYLDEFAGNPMQLTILLDLMHKHGKATRPQRTALYDSYAPGPARRTSIPNRSASTRRSCARSSRSSDGICTHTPKPTGSTPG
jgi:hypothetical protein